MTRRAAIICGNRTPFVWAWRCYAHVSAQDLLVAALYGWDARHGLTG